MTNENDKKMEHLEREEVKTMEKDVSRLREAEAQKERERISVIRAKEEEQREKERLEGARLEAEKRKITEEEAQRKIEEVKKLRKEREEKATSAVASAAEGEEQKREELTEKLKEIQGKEEEERRRFLERVARQAEGGEVEPPLPTRPTPPVVPPAPAVLPSPEKPKIPRPRLPKIPKIPKPPIPKISGIFPEKPSVLNKVWVRILVSSLIFAVLAAVATFWFWYLMVREEEVPALPSPPPAEVEEKPEITIPALPSFINEKILNFGYHIPSEPRTIDTIVIHSVYDALGEDPHSIEGVIEEYKIYKVAAHYLIAQNGAIYQTAPREAVAYHAGISQMPDGRTNVNNFSIGIEIINTKTESPTEDQYLALIQLVKYLQREHNVPPENILGHKDIAPGRKDDPWNFDWEKFNRLIK